MSGGRASSSVTTSRTAGRPEARARSSAGANCSGEVIRSLAGTITESARAAAQISASATHQAKGMVVIHRAIREVAQLATQSVAATEQIERAGQSFDTLSTTLRELLAKHASR